MNVRPNRQQRTALQLRQMKPGKSAPPPNPGKRARPDKGALLSRLLRR